MAFLHELFRYRNKYFLETGTGQGDITQLVADSGVFETIYTLDVNSVTRFQDSKVIHTFQADSASDLFSLTRDILEPITFFFNTGKLIQELLQLQLHPVKTHVVLFQIPEGFQAESVMGLIKQINSEYQFKLHTKDSIHFLAAHVSQYLPISIHKYVKSVPFDSSPPGIGDYLRGCIAMIQHAKTYNYKFYVDHTSHPIFDWLEPSEYSLFYNINTEVKILLPFKEYGHRQIEEDLEKAYRSGESFTCCNNAFYSYDGDKPVTYPTSQYAKEIMRKILVPNAKMRQVILDTYKRMGLQPGINYTVVHLRCGDQTLWEKDSYSPQMLEYYTARLRMIMEQNPGVTLVLITDSSAIGRLLKERLPSLFYTDSPRIHLGVLNKDYSVVPFTLAEMFIIIYSKSILSNSRSGFSDIPSQVFDIPYYPVF
jgi:hypothetical protein